MAIANQCDFYLMWLQAFRPCFSAFTIDWCRSLFTPLRLQLHTVSWEIRQLTIHDKSNEPENYQVVIRQSSGSHQAVIKQSSGSHQAVIRQPPGSHQAVIRQLISITKTFIRWSFRWSSDSHQAVISLSSGSHQTVNFDRLGFHAVVVF